MNVKPGQVIALGLGAVVIAAAFGGRMLWPVRGVITSRFQTPERPDHNGIDIAAEVGTPVLAPGNGVVASAYYDSQYGGGNTMVLELDNGRRIGLAHLSVFLARDGERVMKGEVIAATGETGNARGPHLHLSVKERGEWVDPEPLFA